MDKCPLYDFFTLFGGWRWGPGHNPLVKFSNLGSSNIEHSETDLFDIVTIRNVQISDIMHGLAPLYLFFTLSRCVRGGGGGGSPSVKGTTCFRNFPTLVAQKWESGGCPPGTGPVGRKLRTAATLAYSVREGSWCWGVPRQVQPRQVKHRVRDNLRCHSSR